MLLNTKQATTLALAGLAFAWSSNSKAEVELGKAGGWTVTTDGRVNGFVSHVWGDNRPDGLQNLNWVGFNESNSSGQADSEGKLRKTRIRSGFVPTFLAFNFRKEVNESLKLSSRIAVGIQITNVDPSFIADPTWMDPREAYLNLETPYGSVRAGRDLSLFPRSNLLMNNDLGHGYGVGFPCAYEKMFGGACGHVGFGVLWPDFRAQITYSTPKFADVFQVSVGAFDPRTIPTYSWDQTPYPRVEGEAVADYSWSEGWGFKAWGNGFWQQIGTSADITDETTMVTTRQDFTQNAYGVGGGAQANLGPFKGGFSGYSGQGMDAFTVFTFNPIYIGQGSTVPNYERRFRPTRGILAEASFTIGNTWVMAGYGEAFFDRIDTDIPIDTVDAFPLIRTQRGISTGVFHRIDQVVLGLDYFNAHYGFDPRLVDPGDGNPPAYVDVDQTVHIVNAGMTLEW